MSRAGSHHPNYSQNQSQGTGMDAESMRRIRYMAHMERRARPPTFRPLTIVVVVLSVGLAIIGLIMLVIAHWPGVSGGEGLKIAGGVLVGVGLVIFITTMVVSCVLKDREKNAFEKSIATAAQSRSNISMISRRTATPTPSVDAKPGKSILKKAGSTSTYGTARGSDVESDSGLANHFNSFGGNQSYEHDSSTSDHSARQYSGYRVETLPDPSAAHKTRNGQLPLAGMGLAGSPAMGPGMGVQDHSSTDSEAQIPVPMRVTHKKRRSQSPGLSAGRANPSYTADPGDVDVSQAAGPPPTYANVPAAATYANAPGPAGGYDQYQAVPQPDQHRERERDPEAAERRRQRRQKRTEQALLAREPEGVANQAYQLEAAQQQQQQQQQPPPSQHTTRTKRTVATPGGGTVITTTTTTTGGGGGGSRAASKRTAPVEPPLHESSTDDPLHINIRASPGTAVHITPGTPNYRPGRTAASPSQSSVETEI